jgi:FG-GAP repeat
MQISRNLTASVVRPEGPWASAWSGGATGPAEDERQSQDAARTGRCCRGLLLGRGSLAGRALVGGALALGVLAIPSPAAAEPGIVADFNGDGRADLAVGVPGEDVGAVSNAGAVNVIYGSPTGLNATNNQLWTQDNPSIADQAEANDQFGSALTVGDFNGDGRTDLAVGVPRETVGTVAEAGAVNVLYGSSAGLSATNNQLWTQDSSGIAGKAETGDGFGGALIAGDFNADGRADLAVGVGQEDVGTVAGAGAVNVLYGSSAGLSADGNQLWTQDSPGILDQAETDGTPSPGSIAGDYFGGELAAGDFNGDGLIDLAVGVPLEDVGAVDDAGAVNVIYGSPTGLNATNNQLWTQDSPSIADQAETGDQFGGALTAGDFNGDGSADLGVGAQFEDVGALSLAGAVNVIYGSPSGLNATSDQLWTQGSSGIAGQAETGDQFGGALTAGDFNADGSVDLAVGAEFEAIGTLASAGAVNVIYGSPAGLSATNNQIWAQDQPGITDQPEAGDLFGFDLE